MRASGVMLASHSREARCGRLFLKEKSIFRNQRDSDDRFFTSKFSSVLFLGKLHICASYAYVFPKCRLI